MVPDAAATANGNGTGGVKMLPAEGPVLAGVPGTGNSLTIDGSIGESYTRFRLDGEHSTRNKNIDDYYSSISSSGTSEDTQHPKQPIIKKKLKETGAELAGEMSGHIFFKERWYGFDDALYTGARLLEIVSKSNKTCSEIFDEIPVNVSTPEINIHFEKHGQQFDAMKKLSNNINFPGSNINTIDGVRVDYENCWGLVRASNTTPCLVLRFEANDDEALNEIKNKFKDWLETNNISTKNL